MVEDSNHPLMHPLAVGARALLALAWWLLLAALLWSMRRVDPLALASTGFAVLTIFIWGTSAALS